MKIEITSTVTDERSGTTKDGKSYKVITQSAYLWLDDEPYPFKMRVPVRPESPYSVGYYRLSDKSFNISQYGDIQINRYELHLLPIPIAAKDNVASGSVETSTPYNPLSRKTA